MPWDAAIWAGSTAFSAKLAAACGVAAILLLSIDSRRSAIIWRIFLNLAAISAGIWTSLNCTEFASYAWQGLVALAMLAMLFTAKQWMTIAPTELHREASQQDEKTPKKSKKTASDPRTQSSLFWLPSTPTDWVQVVAVKLTLLIVAWAIYTATSGAALTRWTSLLHTVMTIVALGVSMASAIELTFVSSPNGSTSVNWRMLSFVAILVWIGELACVSQVLFWMDDPNRDLNSSLLVLVFAITAIVINFIVWMIPHRLTQFSKKGTSSDWVSLSIAAWTATLCLALVILLPSSWPWTL